MKSTKLILLHPTIQKQSSSNTNCLWLIFIITFLYKVLNFDSRTIFLDKNENIVLRFKQQHPGIEAYDVYETRVDEMKRLLQSARGEFRGGCRTVQNLLFSECKLALNSLPNHVYELSWEVKLIDSLSGFHKAAQGRMSAIFTVAVLARSKMAGAAEMHIFVLVFNGEAERVYSDEFLCRNNSVEVVGKPGHFVVERASDERLMTEFCRASASANSSLSTSMAQLKDSQVVDKEDDDSVNINGVTNIFLLSFR